MGGFSTRVVVRHIRFWFFLTVMGLFAGFTTTSALAQDADSLAKKVSKQLRSAERMMHGGKRDKAFDSLSEIDAMIEQIRAADPKHKKLRGLESKFKKLVGGLERRTGRTYGQAGAGQSSKSAAAPATTAQPASASQPTKLPSAVSGRLKKLSAGLDKVDKILADPSLSGERGSKRAARALQKASEHYDRIMKYKDQIPAGHPQASPVLARYDAIQRQVAEYGTKVAGNQAAAEAEEGRQRQLNTEWGERLRAYSDSSSPKYFCSCTSGDSGALQAQQALYDELTAVFAELDSAGPTQKNDWLVNIETDVRRRYDNWPVESAKSLGRPLDAAASKLSQELGFLKGKQAWRNNSAERPYVLADDRIDGVRQLIAKAAALLPANDSRLRTLNDDLAKLVALNEEGRGERTKRTFMAADKYSGDGIDAIKKVAAQLVAGKFPGVKVLRATVPSAEWKEETVEEWTDTTQTAKRRRTTRSLSAQVAGEKADGVFLWYLHVAKNRNADGNWGALYGNIMYIDGGEPMVKGNVDKDGPS